jgi:hypothetical protein
VGPYGAHHTSEKRINQLSKTNIPVQSNHFSKNIWAHLELAMYLNWYLSGDIGSKKRLQKLIVLGNHSVGPYGAHHTSEIELFSLTNPPPHFEFLKET